MRVTLHCLVFVLFCGLANAHESVTKSLDSKDFGHSYIAWTSILKRDVVVSGHASLVRYIEIKKHPEALNSFLRTLESVSREQFDHFSENEQLAFLINAYNAFTLKLIVGHYPVRSIRDLGSFLQSPWKTKFFKFLGEETFLDHIEHDLIRKQFNEPRIHFALVCASLGCPALRAEAYTASQLDKQLEEAAKNFLTDETKNRYEQKTKSLKLSSIFKWYGSDFDRKYDGVSNFVASRISNDPEVQSGIRDKKVAMEFLDYDWGLNEEK